MGLGIYEASSDMGSRPGPPRLPGQTTGAHDDSDRSSCSTAASRTTSHGLPVVPEGLREIDGAAQALSGLQSHAV